MWPFPRERAAADAASTSQSTPGPHILEETPGEPSSATTAPDDGNALSDRGLLVNFHGWPNERLSIPLILRGPTLMAASFVCGFSLGATRGTTNAAYRFRAENAHRLPTTQTGWFLYQKSKNYHAMFGGIKEGAKMGSVFTAWATLFVVTEEVVDQGRGRLFARADDEIASGQRDAASTVIAAMTMAGIYSWKKGLDHFAAAKIARTALKFSLAYGLAQDALATLKGTPPTYIQWITNKSFPRYSGAAGDG